MRRTISAIGLLVLLSLFIGLQGSALGAPLTQDTLQNLIKLGISDDEVVRQIDQNGLAFSINAESIAAIKSAGASGAVIKALLSGSTRPADAITYQQVLELVKSKASEDAIIKQLANSPTRFTLDAKQQAELQSAGASPALIAILEGKRPASNKTVEVTDLALILDCSGSMKEHTVDGQPKIAVARRVVSDLVENIPNGLGLTFVIYGQDARAKCNAVEVVRRLSELTAIGKSNAQTLIQRLQPVGSTPIALALRTAGSELARSHGQCGVVLISDGKETCHGDPSAEAAALAKNLNLSFGVNVVGFDVKADERQALEAIAHAGGGQYYNARTAADLNDVLRQLQAKIEQVASRPDQRATRQFAAAGLSVKPGAFFNDASLVEPGEFNGTLGFMDAHYYAIPVQKGQQLRAIGIVKKTPYRANNSIINQTFGVTIYGDNLQMITREKVVVTGNPTTPATVRAIWTAQRDEIVYVAISASGNHGPDDGRPIGLYGDLDPAPSAYTLRFRLSPEQTEDADFAQRLPSLDIQPGRGFNQAGELTVPCLAATDLKLGEVVFYRLPVATGEVLGISLAAQKPWYRVTNWNSDDSASATYTLTLYDDDHVQVAQKKLVIYGNRPDAAAVSETWTVELGGAAFLSIDCQNTGHSIYPEDFDAQPGHLAIQVTKQLEATATAGH